MADDVKARARELLAAVCEKDGLTLAAEAIRSGQSDAEIFTHYALRAIETALRQPAPVWLDIASAPKDGTYILAIVAERDPEDRWQHLSGRYFVIRHEDDFGTGYDMGWSVFPGFGGASDTWFAGWQPLPPPPAPETPNG